MSRRRIGAARWLYGCGGLLALLMGMGLPFPPRGTDAATLAILVTCLAASVAMTVGLRKWYATLRPLSGVLGIYGLYTLGSVPWPARGAARLDTLLSAAIAGCFALCYLVAMLLVVPVRAEAPVPASR